MGRYELEEDGDDDDYDEDQDHVNVNVNVVLGCNENNMFPLTDVLSRTMTVPNINNSNDALYNNCLNEYLPHAVVHSAKPIHYHIYYNSDEETAAYSYRSCGCGATWFWFSLMAVLSHIIYWYGPSVPPPEVSSTWTEFGNEQTFLLKKILTTWVQVGHYVSFWCWQAWKEQHYYSSYWQSTTTITQPPEESSLCRLSPDPWKTTTAPKNPFMLLGQDVVQKRLQSSLQSWKKHSQHTPLILYATGGQAVGKQSLAKLLLQKAFVDCGNTDLLLHIRSNSHKNFMEADLFSKLHNHVLDHPHGSIVLLSHVDEWPPGTLSKLLARIIHTGDVFANCIFIVTSHLGQIVIARTLRKYGGTPEHVPLLELELVLKHKLETHHHNLPPIVDEGEEEDSSPSSSFVNKEETSSKVRTMNEQITPIFLVLFLIFVSTNTVIFLYT